MSVRWNNRLSLILGLPALLFVIVAVSTSAMSDRTAFIGMAILGALF
ncbi:MAG: hypothetical protein GYB65_22975 [Chloroflexi bacterium]|nr:hypothetical protein [Chloroflexota bacterium]